MATVEKISNQDLNLFHSYKSQYPSIPGLCFAASSFTEAVDGTNLTDRLGLAGTLLIFPEFSVHRTSLQHIITLGHQIDHFVDAPEANDPKALRNFNTLYPKLLKEQYGKDNLLVKSLLGFFSQAIIVEKEVHNQYFDHSDQKNTQYRELLNAIWVRMIVSLGTRLSGGDNDTVSYTKHRNFDEIYHAYRNYIEGTGFTNIPDSKRSYVLFLWTMTIQQKYDSMSRYRNRINQNPYLETPGRNYAKLAIQSGVNPLVLHATLKSIELLPYLQRLQRY